MTEENITSVNDNKREIRIYDDRIGKFKKIYQSCGLEIIRYFYFF